jgi:hypothetical protein
MMSYPQLWKLRIIVLGYGENFHHGRSDRAPKTGESTVLPHDSCSCTAEYQPQRLCLTPLEHEPFVNRAGGRADRACLWSDAALLDPRDDQAA